MFRVVFQIEIRNAATAVAKKPAPRPAMIVVRARATNGSGTLPRYLSYFQPRVLETRKSLSNCTFLELFSSSG